MVGPCSRQALLAWPAAGGRSKAVDPFRCGSYSEGCFVVDSLLTVVVVVVLDYIVQQQVHAPLDAADGAVVAKLVGLVPDIVMAFGEDYTVGDVASAVAASFYVEVFGKSLDGELAGLVVVVDDVLALVVVVADSKEPVQDASASVVESMLQLVVKLLP